jgi:mannitol-1-phosphate/altronate dehydrogenase
MSAVFGTDLPGDPRFVSAVTDALARLYAMGARRAVDQSALMLT